VIASPARGPALWSVHVEGRPRQRVCVSAHRCLTCPSVSACRQMMRQRLTRPTSAHFRARHSPVSGQLCGTTGEARLIVLVSCCLSAAGIRFLGLPVPAEGFRLSRDRPTLHPCRVSGPRRGFRVPHERDTGGVGCLLYSGATVLTQPTKLLRLPLPLLCGQPCTPVFLPSSRVPDNGASSEVHCCSPIHPSPRL
jgi:hypothetical protein